MVFPPPQVIPICDFIQYARSHLKQLCICWNNVTLEDLWPLKAQVSFFHSWKRTIKKPSTDLPSPGQLSCTNFSRSHYLFLKPSENLFWLLSQVTDLVRKESTGNKLKIYSLTQQPQVSSLMALNFTREPRDGSLPG